MSLQESRPRLPAITSLRFFAAFHVALFHMKEMGVITSPGWLKSFAGIGYVGVSFFFVLSGFILVYTYAGRTLNLRDFWQARFARIYPAYLFSLVLFFPFFYFGALKMHVPFFAFAEQHFVVACLLVLTLLQAWVPPAALAWNAVAWSLSVEAFYYLVFPFALPKFSKLSRTALLASIAVFWVAGMAVSAGFLALRAPGAPYVGSTDWSAGVQFVKFFPLVRLPEFLMGMACGFLFLRSERRSSVGPGICRTGLWDRAAAELGRVAEEFRTRPVWRRQLQLLPVALNVRLAVLSRLQNPGVAKPGNRGHPAVAGYDVDNLFARLSLHRATGQAQTEAEAKTVASLG